MTKSTFRGLFIENPMFAEVLREKKKAVAEHNWRGVQLAARCLLLVIYLFLLILTIRYVEYVEPYVLMYIMLALVTILIPSGLHGAIAGEREKRSLDMLLVAPVTCGQIIIGKFCKTFLTLLLLVVAVGIPALIIEMVKREGTYFPYGVQQNLGAFGFLRALLLVLTTGLAMGGLTMWVSSRTKTNSGSMLATVGSLFVVLIVVPSIGAVVSNLSTSASELLVYSNPFVLLYFAYTGESGGYSYDPQNHINPAGLVWPMIIVMVLVAAFFLFLATESLKSIAQGRVES